MDRHTKIIVRHVLGVAIPGMACVGAPVVAQAQSPVAATPASDASTVSDIIVTARKREESLQNTPIAVSAFTSQEIAERGIRDIADVALVTPGFSMQNIQAGTEQPFIRGMSTTSFDRTLQTSSSFVDGNYFSVLGRSVFFPDIERVEVVRGPQAALFGRATFAGAINYVTKSPTPTTAGEVRITAGEFKRLDAHGSLSGPLIDGKLLYRISASSEIYGGEYINQLDGAKTGVLRHYGLTGALRFIPTSNLTIDLKGFQTWYRDDGQVPEYIQGAASLNCFPNSAGVNTYYCGLLKPDPTQIKLNLNLVGGGFQKLNQSRFILNADWRLGDYTLTSTTTYAKQTSDTFCDCDYSGSVSSGGAFHSDFVGGITDKSEELRLRSPGGNPFRWVLGGYIFRENSYTYRANAATIVIPYVEVTNRAVFGSVELDLAKSLTVSLDGRYQSERQTRSAIPGNPAIDVTYNAFLPRAIIEFHASDSVNLYASAAKGNQPGQFNTGSNVPAANVKIDSESLWSYEVGAKTKLFEDRLRLNIAAYHVDWSNQVYRTEIIGNDGKVLNILANLGGSRINGLEVDAAVVPAKGLSLNATFAYIDAKYTNFLSPNALRVYGVAQVAGRQLPNTPRYQASFSASYKHHLAADYDVFVRGDYAYRGQQYVAEVNQAYIGNLHLLNGSIGVENRQLRLALRVDNILNADVPDFATRFTDLNSPALSRFGYLLKLRPGRAGSVSLQFKY